MNKKNALRILVGAPIILIVGAIFLWKPIILIFTSRRAAEDAIRAYWPKLYYPIPKNAGILGNRGRWQIHEVETQE